ncbi:MAG TPA: hypothetical protein VFS22_04580 [Flavisolibacter sp.]|nr:hypothetical protein [Flavisolibacter sp.]
MQSSPGLCIKTLCKACGSKSEQLYTGIITDQSGRLVLLFNGWIGGGKAIVRWVVQSNKYNVKKQDSSNVGEGSFVLRVSPFEWGVLTVAGKFTGS